MQLYILTPKAANCVCDEIWTLGNGTDILPPFPFMKQLPRGVLSTGGGKAGTQDSPSF